MTHSDRSYKRPCVCTYVRSHTGTQLNLLTQVTNVTLYVTHPKS